MRKKNLELQKILKPGEEGTEDLVAQFGDALVCVRIWYDPETDEILKTAELVTAIRPGLPSRRQCPLNPGKRRFRGRR